MPKRPADVRIGALSESASGFTPKAADQASLFDHLVGAGEQGRRHVDAEHPGSLCVDDELD